MQQGFFIETKDNGRIHNPYGSALLVDEHNEGFYSLVIPLEGVPTVAGDVETFDYNILTETGKGKTKGKTEVETATTDFMLTKENCYRLDQLKNKVLPYMIFYGNHMGLMFNAEVSYRPNDVDNGDNLKGTLTITPSSVSADIIYDARDMVRQTLNIAGTIPAEVVLHGAGDEQVYNCEVENGEKATGKVVMSGAAAEKYDVAYADNKITIKQKVEQSLAAGDYALARIDFTDTTKMKEPNTTADKYAPYSLFIDLFFEPSAD